MIIKVQQSISSSDGTKRVLLYDKEKNFYLESEDEDEVKYIISLLKKRPKAYFEATIERQLFKITKEVKSENW